jgi:alkyl hydroperoxide reductase subunit F
MLDDKLSAQLAAYLERVTKPIEIVASLDGQDASGELKSLLEQIAGQDHAD